jgi:hypothetical protein
VTPTVELLGEIAHVHESRLSSHPLFVRRHRSANMTLQKLRARLLHCLWHSNRDTFAAEEVLIDLLHSAFEPHAPRARPGRTHELLEYLDQQRAAVRATFERIPASSRSGPLSLYGWIAFAGAHEARHTQQIRECLSV